MKIGLAFLPKHVRYTLGEANIMVLISEMKKVGAWVNHANNPAVFEEYLYSYLLESDKKGERRCGLD